MFNNRIELLKNEYNELSDFLEEQGQVSFATYINDNYKKSLLLSAASYFETIVVEIIIEYAKFCSGNDEKIVSLIEGKTLNRQYHTLFDGDRQNANKFFGLFGDKTKEKARKMLEDESLSDAERAFLSIGRERNKLVHNNYIEVSINSTFNEIYNQYEMACNFVKFLRTSKFPK
ncbi:MAG: hypothetical protein LBL79_15110 [Prevotella sp.]|jgi:uncharacterized protein YozE (UPF0346 family)|nr:hypothetical protein [Prevotella sp.]